MNWKEMFDKLEAGKIRAAFKDDNDNWQVNIDVKETILQAFRDGKLENYQGNYAGFVDKHNLAPRSFDIKDKIRMVPGGSSVRRGVYVAEGVIIMPPAYINIGAYVDKDSMVDSHALVGSCAQIGARVHLSAAVQIGGVLEPIGMRPVIIEDDVFVGAGSIIVEGILIKHHAVIAPGVILSKSVPIYDLVNNTLLNSHEIPVGAVVVPGSRAVQSDFGKQNGLSIQCPVIVKYRDEKTNTAVVLEQSLR
jgi:2,3,4,5-tetrahydropyridine-2-carboxylate N-succinyltransferase